MDPGGPWHPGLQPGGPWHRHARGLYISDLGSPSPSQILGTTSRTSGTLLLPRYWRFYHCNYPSCSRGSCSGSNFPGKVWECAGSRDLQDPGGAVFSAALRGLPAGLGRAPRPTVACPGPGYGTQGGAEAWRRRFSRPRSAAYSPASAALRGLPWPAPAQAHSTQRGATQSREARGALSLVIP